MLQKHCMPFHWHNLVDVDGMCLSQSTKTMDPKGSGQNFGESTLNEITSMKYYKQIFDPVAGMKVAIRDPKTSLKKSMEIKELVKDRMVYISRFLNIVRLSYMRCKMKPCDQNREGHIVYESKYTFSHTTKVKVTLAVPLEAELDSSGNEGKTEVHLSILCPPIEGVPKDAITVPPAIFKGEISDESNLLFFDQVCMRLCIFVVKFYVHACVLTLLGTT